MKSHRRPGCAEHAREHGADAQEDRVDDGRRPQVAFDMDAAGDGEERDEQDDERVVLVENLDENLEAERALVDQVREDRSAHRKLTTLLLRFCSHSGRGRAG